MKFTTSIAAALVFVLPAVAVTLSYDPVYDASSGSLATVACSDGDNGLLTKGYTTFGSLPKFPYIGGAAVVAGWNSASCGTCWNVTYAATKKSIAVLAVDHTDAGYNIAKAAMNVLTNGRAEALGRIDVTAVKVAASVCGL